MYCVNCGVRLADTEEKCPLCDVAVGTALPGRQEAPLYPPDRIPYTKVNKGAVNGAFLILWMIPLLVVLFVDLQVDWVFGWSYYVAGAMVMAYVIFALPVTGGLALVVTTVVTLLRYIKKGRLYILGGAFMALGAMMLLAELLMMHTFSLPFSGWSVYPLIVLVLLGGTLIFLGINKTARERMERRFFF